MLRILVRGTQRTADPFSIVVMVPFGQEKERDKWKIFHSPREPDIPLFLEDFFALLVILIVL
jgi:hypothetical protein